MAKIIIMRQTAMYAYDMSLKYPTGHKERKRWARFVSEFNNGNVKALPGTSDISHSIIKTETNKN